MDFKAKIDAGGRILIPSQLRKLMHLESGDEIILSQKNGCLTLTTLDDKLAAIQAKAAQRIPDDVSLVDEVINLRREDAMRG